MVVRLVCALGLIFGYGRIVHALRDQFKPRAPNLGSAFYPAGSSVLTFGPNGLEAVGGLARFVLLAAGASDLAVLTMLISFMLTTYARLKGLGIEPVLAADHGVTTSFYCEDPDRNSVELTVDNFGDWEKSSEYMRTSPEFAAKPMGTYVDPDKMITARKAGTPVEELHRRAYAGEFPPSKPTDPSVLM